MSTLVIVGGGPRATGVLLALAADLRARHSSAAVNTDVPADVPTTLDIHVVDPFPVGGGRIWRAGQDKVLWMNSTAAEITVYASDLAGQSHNIAPVDGPTLASWISTMTDRDSGTDTFIPRRDLFAYLSDAVDRARVVLEAVPGVSLILHQASVVEAGHHDEAIDGSGRLVILDNGTEITADVVLLSQGHLDIASPPVGEGHIPPGFTADMDWSSLHGGDNVLVRGMGLAFIDLMMLLTEGRGGRFRSNPNAVIPTYLPSGNEPVLWVGSGRGVPYRSKLTDGPLPVELRYLPTAARFAGPEGFIDRETLELLLEAELSVAWYDALAAHHPERTRLSATEVHRVVDAIVEHTGETFDSFRETVRRLVPDPADHLLLPRHNAPLAGRHFTSRAELETAVNYAVQENLVRATDSGHRQDGALYGGLVASFFALHALAVQGLLRPEDRQKFLSEEVGSIFAYTCSGPPPERLANLLSLHEAGLIRFLGPEISVRSDGQGYIATSPAVDEEIWAEHLVDARLAPFDAAQVTDPLLRSLNDAEEITANAEGFLVDTAYRAVGADSQAREDLFIVGPASTAHVREAFGRPGTPGRAFAANSELAAQLLNALTARAKSVALH